MIRTYAATQPTTLEHARDLWASGSHVANAEYRKTWWGPSWFAAQPSWNATKIAVHEVYHVFQYELAGVRALNSGPDDIPRAGPRWLSEGGAELFAYQAIDRKSLRPITVSREEWIRTVKSQPDVSLEELAYLRAQGQVTRPYDMYALAVEYLTRDRAATAMVAYFAAIGAGTSWQSAFASAFGRTIEAFYAEFDSYRRTL
jgi:hypothetical protein